MDEQKRRVIVTRRLPHAVESALAAEFVVSLNRDDVPMTVDDIHTAMQHADAIVPCVGDKLPSSVFGDSRTRIIANFGAGTDHIDLTAARERGIVVTNTPGVLTEDTADLTIGLILAVARRMGEGERELRAGNWTGWRPTHLLGTRVTGATLGIIGYGRIGRAVANRASRGFDMRVLVHSRAAPELDEGHVRAESLGQLLREADFVSLHVPSTPDTRALIGEAELRLMKPTAFLVNTARGDVIEENALIRALNEGWIAGAALDVYPREPSINPALLSSERLVLLPHLGSATTKSREAMGFVALRNLQAFFAGQEPPNRVA